MSINLTCLNAYPPLPVIPVLANDSTATTTHPKYNPESGGLSQVISSAIITSVFSIDDVRSLLRRALDEPWKDFSDVSKMAPIPSIIIYSSIALTFFLILSLVFCVVSCLNFGKRTSDEKKRTQSKSTQVCICLAIIVYLLGIGDMVYVAYRVNKSKVSIDESIKYANRDIYPNGIANHLTYLIQQMENLDRYCTDHHSILINASKSMIIKTFGQILDENYHLSDIVQTLNRTTEQIQDLNRTVEPDQSIPSVAKVIFANATGQYQSMIVSLQTPLQEICLYSSGAETDIDSKLLQALDIVRQQLRKIINTIQRDVLDKIATSSSQTLLDIKLEEDVRGYVNMAGMIFLILVIFLTIIPVAFAGFAVLSCICCGDGSESSSEDYHDVRMHSMNRVSSASSSRRRQTYPTKSQSSSWQDDTDVYDDAKYSSKRPSRVLLCLMRIAFAIMIIMLIVMAALTGVYYALDLVMQGGCRTVHNDQPFLIPFITDQVVRTTGIFANSSDLNTSVSNIIDDCHDHVHFTRKLMSGFWHTLDRQVREMMNELNNQIYEQFNTSIAQINIPHEIGLLTSFVALANITEITNKVAQINTDLGILEMTLANISSTGMTLPANLTNSTIAEFSDYVKEVLESTLDSCPLPLDMIYRTDTLICHRLGNSISGLWLSVFFYMFVITAGLCIFGVWVYKRLV